MNNKQIIIILFFLINISKVFSNNMIFVEGGTFEMGTNREIDGPIHSVIVDSFYISKYELTMEDFDLFFKEVKPNGVDDFKLWRPPIANLDFNYYFKVVRKEDIPSNLPMIGITWNEAVMYCNWKSKNEGFTPAYIINDTEIEWVRDSNGYRLPTEAEWEFAARGGNLSKDYLYAGSNNPDEVSWFKDNSEKMIHPVGQKKPNELGLYDFSGNVAEWCWDFFDYLYFSNSPYNNPTGPTKGRPLEDDDENTSAARVSRGGTYWGGKDIDLFYRGYSDPDSKNSIGLRIVRSYSDTGK